VEGYNALDIYIIPMVKDDTGYRGEDELSTEFISAYYSMKYGVERNPENVQKLFS
jgi:hypothetical protein